MPDGRRGIIWLVTTLVAIDHATYRGVGVLREPLPGPIDVTDYSAAGNRNKRP